MVAVKGQCAQLMPAGRGGAGTLFVYPPPPSLTDDGIRTALQHVRGDTLLRYVVE